MAASDTWLLAHSMKRYLQKRKLRQPQLNSHLVNVVFGYDFGLLFLRLGLDLTKELAKEPRVTLGFWFPCLHFPSTGIMGVSHHSQFFCGAGDQKEGSSHTEPAIYQPLYISSPLEVFAIRLTFYLSVPHGKVRCTINFGRPFGNRDL